MYPSASLRLYAGQLALLLIPMGEIIPSSLFLEEEMPVLPVLGNIESLGVPQQPCCKMIKGYKQSSIASTNLKSVGYDFRIDEEVGCTHSPLWERRGIGTLVNKISLPSTNWMDLDDSQ